MRSVPVDTAPFAVSVETSDLDEAREVCGEHLYPHSLRMINGSTRFAGRFGFLHMAGLTVADAQYGAELAGESGELGSYHVNLPLAGTFAASQGGRAINGTTGRAGVYRPVGENVLHRSSADCRLLALKIGAADLDGLLALMLDAPVRGSVRLAGELDVRRQPGRGFAAVIRLLGAEINNPTGLAFHPIVAAPLEEWVLMSLLFAVGHQYQDHLKRRQAQCSPLHVARAIDAIHAEPQRPYTVAALAEIAGVSPRSLGQAFHREVGMAPMAYLREIRMEGAHTELRTADPALTSVADVARRWGYARPGRFAERYRAVYHADPSETLHNPRGR
jgi:AraC-like DNA-binding protein